MNTDGTYEVLIDNESAQKGSLTEDGDVPPPKKIKDKTEQTENFDNGLKKD